MAMLMEAGPDLVTALQNGAVLDDLLLQRDRLESRVEAHRRDRLDLLHDASHALATPATYIPGFVDIVLESASSLSDEELELLRIVRAGSTQILALGQNMGRLYDILAEQLDVTLAPIDLGRLLARVAQEAEAVALELGLQFDLALPSDPLMIYSDAELLEAILHHLLDNALTYTPPPGWVRLAWHEPGDVVPPTEAPGEMVCISVSDSGVGIPAEELSRVFEPFYRLRENYVRSKPGNGLGLAIARGLVELLEGGLWLESEVQQGTAAYLAIPLNVVA
jgi:signal transduction histidine kinase